MDGYPRLIYIFTILFPTEIYIFPLFNLIQHYMKKCCQWLETFRWFSPDTPVFSSNKTHRHDITEILLKVELSKINLNQTKLNPLCKQAWSIVNTMRFDTETTKASIVNILQSYRCLHSHTSLSTFIQFRFLLSQRCFSKTKTKFI